MENFEQDHVYTERARRAITELHPSCTVEQTHISHDGEFTNVGMTVQIQTEGARVVDSVTDETLIESRRQTITVCSIAVIPKFDPPIEVTTLNRGTREVSASIRTLLTNNPTVILSEKLL